ncbi:MAG: hypothetical protein FJ278_09480 [Planctomycetes bacterium]|nr:hypothetical protein [Planctomycetota bacterium]
MGQSAETTRSWSSPLRGPAPLWEPGKPFPAVSAIPVIADARHSLVHRAVEGEYQFLHESAALFHGDALFVFWNNARVDECAPDQVFRGRRSQDGGRTWSEPEMIAPPLAGGVERESVQLLSHAGRLWAFGGRVKSVEAGRDAAGGDTEALVLNEQTGRWESQGIVAREFHPLNRPTPMADGHWIMGGQFNLRQPRVAISHGADFTRWDVVKLPVAEGVNINFAETAVSPSGHEITAICRSAKPVALAAWSRDFGRTWDEVRESNLPMQSSKPCAGVLSTGQRYLLFNAVNQRNTLAIAVSQPGERFFSRVWKVRGDLPPQPRHPGRSKSPQWSYPAAVERDGCLHVTYSVSKEDCALSVIPCNALR